MQKNMISGAAGYNILYPLPSLLLKRQILGYMGNAPHLLLSILRGGHSHAGCYGYVRPSETEMVHLSHSLLNERDIMY